MLALGLSMAGGFSSPLQILESHLEHVPGEVLSDAHYNPGMKHRIVRIGRSSGGVADHGSALTVCWLS